jgi:hypothetical protein
MVAVVTLVEVMRLLGLLPDAARDALTDVSHPPVYGGGRRVGAVVPTLESAVAT